ncbi:MAG TPA: metallophosphoesterase [Candidatus Caccopulliclostridium gallistercoris]|uniref:Metallophosphoesterase n=1 Tax=Candidatus Caccopulliclostridium gallistercoris TaxID=2840719 RepID=A0A9D1NET1_9FIRM|nr:metallophosphoesterase [Candidatus Caccopulliclostridium gallistercoris]
MQKQRFNSKLNLTEGLKNYQEKQRATKDESVLTGTVDESSKFDTAVLVYISDLHIGTFDLDINWLIEVTNYVLNTPNAKVLLLGDLLNTAILNAVSNMYEDIAYPQEQWQIAVDLFSSLSAQNKIIAICAGNHERRVYKQTGIETLRQFAHAIDAEKVYAPYYANIDLILKCADSPTGSFTIPIVAHHGDGVGNISGVKKLQDIDSGSYINTVGHLHREQLLIRGMPYYDPVTNTKRKKAVLDVILPSAGGGYYAKEKMLQVNYKSPYLALEVTAVKNPRYEKFKNADWQEEEIIPAVRTIPIMQAADTAQKNKYIKTANRIIAQKEKELNHDFLLKLNDLLRWMKEQGVDITNSVRAALKQEIRREQTRENAKEIVLKPIDRSKE